MKATGIVRRIDELGRVVIPKEIRRSLRIKEGDPLELYTTPNGEVVFKKYNICADVDWDRVKSMVKILLPSTAFAIMDNYGEMKAASGSEIAKVTLSEAENYPYMIHQISSDEDTLAYLVTKGSGECDVSRINTTVCIMREFLESSVI